MPLPGWSVFCYIAQTLHGFFLNLLRNDHTKRRWHQNTLVPPFSSTYVEPGSTVLSILRPTNRIPENDPSIKVTGRLPEKRPPFQNVSGRNDAGR